MCMIIYFVDNECFKVLKVLSNDSFGSWAPVVRVILSYKFDQPEVIPDRAKMNLASHRVWRLSRNYFEPGTYVTQVFCCLLVSTVLAPLDSAITIPY